VWDLVSGQCTATFEGLSNKVNSFAISHDGRSLATASNVKTAQVCDLASGQCAATLEGHSNKVISVAFGPCSRSLATASWDMTA
jgi:WD40 repeat protein